ncbi:hypothetical protein [Geodermatophilus aquaeductus]|uniref:hypothetical protein n=1 Tax=Geodermatophilus aquaeductus TaxID=1564161 RepID=UPI0011587E76|nr:hypothetical protein [Geodermatophilus aquaeductus]
MSVDVKRLKRALRDDDGPWLLVSASSPGALGDVLASWAAEAEPRLGQLPGLMGVQLLGPLALPDGVFLLRLVTYAEAKRLVAVVTDLSATLEAAGLDARIDVAPKKFSPLGDIPTGHRLTAVSVTLPWRPGMLDRREQRRAANPPATLRAWHRSDLQEEAWAAVVDTALAWCQELRSSATGNRYVVHGLSSLQTAPAQWEATARLALGSASVPVRASVEQWPDEARDVCFEFTPHRVLFQLDEEAFGSAESTVAQVRELIERLTPHITSAFAMRAAHAPTIQTAWLLRGWARTAAPAAPVTQIHALAPMDDRRIIDAFGVMYLGPGFRGLAADPQMYSVEQLGAGRLLTANDPDAWFRPDGQTPQPEVLEAARADIADAIVTYDEYYRAKRSDGQDIPPLLD